jgi:branched-chain amino acid transport system substrate-binding protein
MLRYVIAGSVAALSTVCGGSVRAQQPAPNQDPIVVGATVPLTSPYALSGRSYYDSLRMAEEDINAAGGIGGRKLKIVFEDTSNSNTVAVSAFKKLVGNNKPAFVFLNSYTVQNLATEPEVQRAEIPVMYLGGGEAVAERKDRWMFRVRPSDGLAAKVAAEFSAKDLKLKKVGLLGVEGDFGEGGMRSAAAALTSLGVTVVGQQIYRAADKDISAQLLSLKGDGAEGIILFPYSPEVSIILRQRRQLNLNIPLIGASPTCRTGAMSLMSAQDLDGVYCFTDNYLVGNEDPRVHAWVERFSSKYGVAPDSYGVAAYDGAFVLKQALEKAGADPKALRDAIASTRDFRGIGSTYSFDENGDGVHQLVVLKAKSGTKDFEFIKAVSPDH